MSRTWKLNRHMGKNEVELTPYPKVTQNRAILNVRTQSVNLLKENIEMILTSNESLDIKSTIKEK
jgi:hypothetical protein